MLSHSSTLDGRRMMPQSRSQGKSESPSGEAVATGVAGADASWAREASVDGAGRLGSCVIAAVVTLCLCCPACFCSP